MPRAPSSIAGEMDCEAGKVCFYYEFRADIICFHWQINYSSYFNVNEFNI